MCIKFFIYLYIFIYFSYVYLPIYLKKLILYIFIYKKFSFRFAKEKKKFEKMSKLDFLKASKIDLFYLTLVFSKLMCCIKKKFWKNKNKKTNLIKGVEYSTKKFPG